MELTQEQLAKYLKAGGVSCPWCGDHDITGGSVQIDAGRAYQRITCAGCGADWTDGYTLDSVGYGKDFGGSDFDFDYLPDPRAELLAAAEELYANAVDAEANEHPETGEELHDWEKLAAAIAGCGVKAAT